MKVSSSGIEKGYFLDCFGGNGDLLNENGMPTYSIPFKLSEVPEQTQSFAAILYDIDAYEVTKGFPWIHWVVANLTRTEVVANESQTATDFIQGVNSWHSPFKANQSKEASAYYGGMTPPNRDHTYTLKVIALDTLLALEKGFFLNDLINKMKGHVLATAVIEAKYRKIHEN